MSIFFFDDLFQFSFRIRSIVLNKQLVLVEKILCARIELLILTATYARIMLSLALGEALLKL